MENRSLEWGFFDFLGVVIFPLTLGRGTTILVLSGVAEQSLSIVI
jgi:hypothetical protein